MLVPHHIENLRPYEAGKSIESLQAESGLTEIYKLGSNENPLGPSPKVAEAIQKTIHQIFRYPDTKASRLREALAKRFKVKIENCVVGNGSEGIMSAIIGTFLHDKDEVLTASCTFTGFFVLTRARGLKLNTVPLKGFCFDLDAMAAAITPNTKIIFLCNPNNPTGTIFTRKEFERFMTKVPEGTLVILDEAYAEFALDNPDFPDSMSYRLDNCITLRTFSKVYGLAGMRIGYGFAHENLIQYILKVKLPFEPSVLAQAAAAAALEDQAFVEETLRVVREGRDFFVNSFKDIGLRVLPSEANFVTLVFNSEEEAMQIYEFLLKKGIIVRPLKNFGMEEGLRISVGKKEENIKCIEALQEIVKA
jgi:histidinol-phosphate aminotransferase